MLEKIFDSSGSGLVRVRLLRQSLHGSILDSFSGELVQSRYANITARRHLRSAEHFAYWASRQDVAVSQWSEGLVERFGRHLHQRRCSYGHAEPVNQLTGISLFLTHLRATHVVSTPPADPAGRPPILVTFRRWMYERRGTLDGTLDNYDIPIRTLLKHFGDPPRQLNAQRLRQCFLGYSDGRSHAVIKHCATALRMFVRAILLLLARLGLRAGDVVQLRLVDIDWKGSWLHVYGKSRRETRLPLIQEVGDALVDYLRAGRPQTGSGRVFVCCRAPFDSFSSHAAVSLIVDQAMRRAEVTPPGRGAAHLLRHSVATALLRQGTSLQDIATVLRHRSIQTTQIYAKVDIGSLDQIAQPWPEVQPC